MSTTYRHQRLYETKLTPPSTTAGIQRLLDVPAQLPRDHHQWNRAAGDHMERFAHR